MVDKTETITVLPHPFDRDNNELTDQEARIAATVNNRDVWKLTTTVPWSSYPNNTLSMPRTSGELPPLGDYQVELNRGNAKRGKEGSGNDYDYYWNAITWKFLGEVKAPTPSGNGGSPSGNGTTTSSSEAKKDRSVALSYAKDAWCAGKIERSELIKLAGLFHDAMVNGFTEEE